MLKQIIDYINSKTSNNYFNEVRYTYFTDSDLVDDTNYIYKILFKRTI